MSRFEQVLVPSIARKLYIRKLQIHPPHPNNVAALLCEQQLI